MATPVWQPGTLYNPGATVQRASSPPLVVPVPDNANFELGDTGWTKGTGWTIEQKGSDQYASFDGTWAAKFAGVTAGSRIENDEIIPVAVGAFVSAQCQVRQGDSNANVAGARCEIHWLDESQQLIEVTEGTLINAEPKNKWVPSTVSGAAPAGAAYFKLAAWAFRTHGPHPLWVDTFKLTYSYQVANPSLVFTAVQANAGFSGVIEPVWPNVNGQQVVDNEVTWEALDSSRVVWEANPILVSGYDEPEWPLDMGGEVADNTITWTAIPRRVVDENCPNTPIVAIATSKVYCGDDDIVAFSAVVNPLDWTTAEDAGYIPFGLQNFGANPVRALGLYRSNLVIFNSEGFQMWQIDEDPLNNSILDAGPIGCIHPRTLYAVHNDLVFLSPVGVRNIGIAAASTNLQAGTFGYAVDPLVLPLVRAGEYDPMGLFVPSLGQYWLIFGDEAIVLTISDTKKQSWSRYTFPEAITDWTLEGGDLLLRTDQHKVWRVSSEYVDDDHNCPTLTVDLPYMPDDLGPGTLVIDANAVIDRTSGTGGNFEPDSYLGNPAVFDPPAYALVLQDMDPGAGDLEVVINGLDENGDPVTETITFDGTTEYRYIVGSQLFSQIDSVDQSGITADQFFSVGYQRFVADEEADTLTVTIHGYWGIETSSDPVSNNGLFTPEVDVPQVLPATSVLVVRHNINTTTTERVYLEDTSGASVTLPPGAPDRVIVGTDELDSILFIDRTGSGGVTPFVDLGIQFEVAAACTGEDIQGVMWWPFLDWGNFGTEKELAGFDLVATAPEGLTVSVGFNQRDRTQRTAEYTMTEADTLPGQMVPFPVTAPSFDFRITFAPGQRWEWNASNMYLMDRRTGR